MHIEDEELALRASRCRCRTAEPARIAFGGRVLACALLSISPGGAEACLESLTHVPDLVTLRLPGGENRSMRCIWQNGLHVGLQAVGTASPPTTAE